MPLLLPQQRQRPGLIRRARAFAGMGQGADANACGDALDREHATADAQQHYQVSD